MNWIVKGLLTIVGVNDPTVFSDRVPRDAIHRYATVGMAMIATTIFAFIAATASAAMVFEDHPWRAVLAPGFGMLWALAIFAIDRTLVLSMRKARWPALVARVILAILIAVSISAPLDIALFSERIEAKLLENRENAELSSQRRLVQIHGLDGLREQSSLAREEVRRLEQAAQIWPPQVLAAQEQAETRAAELARMETRTQRQLSLINGQRADLQARLGNLSTVKPQPQKQIDLLRSKLGDLNMQRTRLYGELRVARKTNDQAQAERREAELQYQKELGERQQHARQDLQQATGKQQAEEETVSSRSAEAQQIIAKSLAGNFVARAEALHQLVSENAFVRSVYLLILMLWATIELAPVLVKSMGGTNDPIDVLLEAKGRELELEYVAKVQAREDEILNERVHQEVLRERLPALIEEEASLLQALAREQLVARTVLAPQQEIFKVYDNLLEQIHTRRQHLKHAGHDRATRKKLEAALSALEKSATDSIRNAFLNMAGPREAGNVG